MKVFIVLIIATASASARGSGPYLPSGWKPDGSTFYLPTEIAKATGNPLKETLYEETEASGSDAFREYGPSKLEPMFLNINQGLPDVATEQAFIVEVKGEKLQAVEDETTNDQGNAQLAAITEKASTAIDSQVAAIVQPTEEQVKELVEIQVTVESKPQNIVELFIETTKSPCSDADEIKEDSVQPTVVVKQEEVKVQEQVVPTDIAKEEIVKVQQDIIPIIVAKEEEIIVKNEVAFTVVAKEEVIVPNAVEDSLIPTDQQESVQDALSTATVTETVIPITEEKNEQDALPAAVISEAVILLVENELVQDHSTGVSEETTTVNSLPEKEVQDAAIIHSEVTEDVNNISEVLGNLEKEVGTSKVPAVNENISTPETSGVLGESVEGFNDFNPSFAVYGPPKQENLARLAVAEIPSDLLENTEVRRRRFSPKLRANKTH